MIKTFLILISFSTFVYSSQQILLVVADTLNTSKAKLAAYENGKTHIKPISVNIGKNGLAMGLGEIELNKFQSTLKKIEGDKKAPIGVFKLSSIFGYSKVQNFHMPYMYASENIICVDESNSKNYNKIIHMPKEQPRSFEYMRRKDAQYELGIVVEHNKKALKQRGSCIFLHVQKEKDAGTAGCTSMSLDNLKKIVSWLDSSKNPILIQIPKSYAKEIIKLYPELKNSELLK